MRTEVANEWVSTYRVRITRRRASGTAGSTVVVGPNPPVVLAFDWGLVLSIAGAVAGAVATLFIWRTAQLAVPQVTPSEVEVRTTDDELLYREHAFPDTAPGERRVVTIDRPQPGMAQHDVMTLVAREIIEGLRTQPASQPSVLPWLIPALLVFAVGVGDSS